MKMEYLNEFVLVVRHGGFNRAARNLFVSQSTLSDHMRAMELELGFDLFKRERKAMELTPAGVRFLRYAQSILCTYDEAREACADIARKRAPLKINEVDSHFLPYEQLRSQMGLEVEFVTLRENDFPLDGLIAGTIDVAFMVDYTLSPEESAKAEEAGVVGMFSSYCKAARLVSDESPLARKDVVGARDLERVRVVLTDPAFYDVWASVIKSSLGEGTQVRVILTPELKSDAELLPSSLGDDVYICDADTIHDHFDGKAGVRIFEDIEGREIRIPMCVAYRKDSEDERILALVDRLCPGGGKD